jgi:DNA-directed RNA polymerase specialized sigma24 family protein
MNFAEQVVRLLPQLRRFARALTGSQKSGDAYVRATLEAMAEDDGFAPQDADPTIALFGAFCRLWRSVDINRDAEPDKTPWQANADLRLAAMVPEERVVFLLRQLEGFGAEQTAAILGTDVPTVDALMREAEADIAAQLASRVLIIEDEQLVSLDLSRLVISLGHEVSSVARTRNEALAAIAKERPELILADIQLADGSSGIDAVNDILREYSPPVVFITAHPDLLLTGERPEPTYLVSKPYDPEAVKAIISQVLFFQSNDVERKVA